LKPKVMTTLNVSNSSSSLYLQTLNLHRLLFPLLSNQLFTTLG